MMMKRTFDFLGAAFGLLVAGPLILALVWVIRRESSGPGIFSQQRVGRDGRLFVCHKLRTMHADSPNVPTHLAPAGQVTATGGFLRRQKLDELPQLWNVLKGDMSFVGPRPCLPMQAALIEERQKRGVFALRPGITGLAQINRIDMSDPVRLAEKDAQYLASRSFMLDMGILFRTIFGGAGNGDRVGGQARRKQE